MSETVEDLIDLFCPVITLHKVNFRTQDSYDVESRKFRCSPCSITREEYSIGALNEAGKFVRLDTLNWLIKAGWRTTEYSAWRVVWDTLNAKKDMIVTRRTNDRIALDILFNDSAFIAKMLSKS